MQPHHVLVLPDIHVPYHDQGVIDAVLRYAKDQTWEQCVILGDFMDFDVLSSFNRGLMRPNEGKRLRDDYVAGNKLLDQIQAAVRHKNPACKIVLLEGNHEYRTERFVDEFAMFEGLLDVEAHLRLAERGIEYVRCYSEGKLYTIGHAYFHHGQAVNKNHAKTMVERFGVNIFFGHTHDVMTYPVSRWGPDNTIVGQSLGCLCKYDQAYMKGRPSNWQHAFADFWFWPDGTFQYHVTSIFDGKFFGPNGKGYTRS